MDALEAALSRTTGDATVVHGYYLPVARWCRSILDESPKRPVVVGVSGPQGAGKSTLADAVVRALGACGVRGIAISIDDFYLTFDQQQALAARFPGNRALGQRGYPGTHDVALGCAVLDDLAAGRTTLVPTYDKSAHQGLGDRAPASSFRCVEGRLDVVILEGWMLGFAPVDPDMLAPELRAPNEMLAAYARWHERLDALVRLDARSLDDVVRWRVGSERARRERGEGALSEEGARDYIERFLPAYRLYLPGLRARPPCARVLAVELDGERRAVRVG